MLRINIVSLASVSADSKCVAGFGCQNQFLFSFLDIANQLCADRANYIKLKFICLKFQIVPSIKLLDGAAPSYMENMWSLNMMTTTTKKWVLHPQTPQRTEFVTRDSCFYFRHNMSARLPSVNVYQVNPIKFKPRLKRFTRLTINNDHLKIFSFTLKLRLCTSMISIKRKCPLMTH